MANSTGIEREDALRENPVETEREQRHEEKGEQHNAGICLHFSPSWPENLLQLGSYL